MILAGWMNRQQQEVLEYLRTENRVLKLVFNTEKSHLLAGKVVMTTRLVFGTTHLLGLGGGWIHG